MTLACDKTFVKIFTLVKPYNILNIIQNKIKTHSKNTRYRQIILS